MKFLMLLFIVIFCHSLMGQVKIQPNFKSVFDSIITSQPKDIQYLMQEKELNNGLTLILNYKEDTLNIKEFIPNTPDSSIEIVLIDPETGKKISEFPKDTNQNMDWLPCIAYYSNDTLKIVSFFGFFSGFGFSIRIIGAKSEGEFMEYADEDSIYRYNLKDEKSKMIQIKALTENVILTKIPKKIGDVFQGKATLISEPFFIDDDQFQKGYLQKRYYITFLFSAKLSLNE